MSGSLPEIGRLALVLAGNYFAPGIGGVLGGIAGNFLFPQKLPDVVGPRLSDPGFTGSSQGVPISEFFGTIPTPGNVIWATALQEHEHHDSQGGKGGPQQHTTTFTYTISFALALGRPIAGILRIWENAKLVYDQRPQQPGETDDAFAKRIAASEGYGKGMTVYLGTSDQLPDPTIEADKGVGNVPAHRSLSYIVFKDKDVTDLGGRVPSFVVEVSTNLGDPDFSNYIVDPAWTGYPSEDSSMPVRITSTTVKFSEKQPSWQSPPMPTTISQLAVASSLWTLDGQTQLSSGTSYYGLTYPPPFVRAGIVGRLDSLYYGVTGYVLNAPIEVAVGRVSWDYTINPDPVLKGIWFVGGAEYANIAGGPSFSDLANTHICNYYNYGIYVSFDAQSETLYRWATDPIGIPGGFPVSYTYATGLFTGSTTLVELHSLCPSGSRLYVLVRAWQSGGGYRTFVQEINPEDLSPIQKWELTPYWATGDYVGLLVSGNFVAVCSSGSGNQWLQIFQLHGDNTVTELDNTVTELVRDGSEFFGSPSAGARVFPDPNLRRMKVKDRWVRLPYGIDASPITLADIVSPVCLKCGMTVDDFDVSELTETIKGYRLDRVTTGRGAIEPLRSFGFFDCVESGAKLTFPLRGKATVATLTTDDLAAYDAGSDIPPPVSVERTEDVELPRMVRVHYLMPHAEYQVGEQKRNRLITSAVNTTDVDLAISMSDDKAAQIAKVLLAEAWIGRETYKTPLPPKWLALEPSDAIMLPVDGQTQRARIASVQEAMPGKLELQLRRDDTIIYDVASVTGTPNQGTGNGTLGDAGATLAVFIDGPALLDSHNDAGVYIAARGDGSTWGGAGIYGSIDGGSNYSRVLTVTAPSTMGLAETALATGEWTIWDDINSVVVDLESGTLESRTEEAVFNGANAAFLGAPGRWELIQFRTATLLSPGRYQLSGLLRGRRGSEWTMGLHWSGDFFVLCTTLSRLPLQTSAIGQSLLFKAVTFGQSVEAAGSYSLTPAGVGLVPFAPCHIAGAFNDVTGDLTITWYRRARLSAEWLNGTDVPLNEQFLQFEIDIIDIDGTTVLRTLTASSNRVKYTAAQILADFGSPQTSIDVAVYQISAAVGRGYRGRACT